MQKSDDKRLAFLVTGGAGFIGSHLCESLLSLGHQVLAVDDLSTGSIDNVSHLHGNQGFQFVRANIAEEVVMDRLASTTDVIIHLAAAVGVKLIVDRPVHTIETNIMGTEYVLKSALRYGCRVLLASTSEVYGKGVEIPFREEDDVLLGPTCRNRWSYAASKMVDEFLGFAYQSEFGLEVASFRLFNTVGPRQTGKYGMVVPRFISQALRDKPITVYGDGKQKRCFCDVRDAVDAIVGLAVHPDAPGKIYNIGGEEEVSIIDLAELVRNITGSRSEIVYTPYSEAYAEGFEDMARRVPSIDRIRALLSWEPKYNLEETLHTIQQYLKDRPLFC